MSITPDHHPKECVCGGTGRVSMDGRPTTNPFRQRPCSEFWIDPRAPIDLTEDIQRAGAMARDNAWRSMAKYPNTVGMFVSLLQEAGELATVLRSGDRQLIYREALDVAAIAIRIAVEGDQDAARAFDPLREISERERQLDELTKENIGMRGLLILARRQLAAHAAPLDENDCPMPTCPGCGAYHELVRPGKTQPTCLCDAFQHEVDQHRETKELVASLRKQLERFAQRAPGEKP